MRATILAVLCLLTGGLLAGLVTGAARAADAAAAGDRCAAPESLTFVDAPLPGVAARIAAHEEVHVIVLGSSSSVTPARQGMPKSYIASLPAALEAKLPGLRLKIDNRSARRLTAEQMADGIRTGIAAAKPDLLLWQTGNVDAAQQIDINLFGAALENGLQALKASNIDVVLIAPQYRARLSALIDAAPYDDVMGQIAGGYNALVFPRYDIMRHWDENDVFDLRHADQAMQMREAEAENRCLAELLAGLIVRAAAPAREGGGQ
ncbi:MAG TPA: hypothetical protein VF194_04270 [Ferrovibrio sp.]|uniref:SGNH/GDSL hydrolase family protein n=1 Tax=Ferrovibrio sp. TaxID=1917215 RepID=UPI002ED21E58